MSKLGYDEKEGKEKALDKYVVRTEGGEEREYWSS